MKIRKTSPNSRRILKGSGPVSKNKINAIWISGFLKHVGSYIRFAKLKLSQKRFMQVFSGFTLKSHMMI